MTAFSPNQRAVVSRHLAGGAAAFVGDAADAADVVLAIVGADVPAPLGDGVPVFDDHLHPKIEGREVIITRRKRW